MTEKDFYELLSSFEGGKSAKCNCSKAVAGVNKFVDQWGSHFEVLVAGVEKEQISVKVKDRSVILINVNQGEPDIKYEVKGIFNSKLSEIYVDPARFNIDGLKVTLKSGILYIAIPFKEEAQPYDVNIE